MLSVIYIGDVISLCFYPLSGYLADNVLERYKIMITRIKILYNFLHGDNYTCYNICSVACLIRPMCLDAILACLEHVNTTLDVILATYVV